MHLLLAKYLNYTDRYISPNYPRGGAATLRDFRWIWGLHFLPAVAMAGLVELAVPNSDATYWFDVALLVFPLIGFPLFAFFRHRHIRNDIDRRFDEMPGIFDPDGDPHLERLRDRARKRGD